jgi:hypothetical protein
VIRQYCPFLCHVSMTLPMTSCINHVLPSKRISSSIAPMIDSVLKFLPRWGMSSLPLELEKKCVPFRAFNRVGQRRWSNEAQYQHSHGEQPNSTRCVVTHSRKEKMHERSRIFPPSNSPDIFVSS